jgi:hypothetical protein
LVAAACGDDSFTDIHGVLPVEEVTASISKVLPERQPSIIRLGVEPRSFLFVLRRLRFQKRFECH